MNNTTSKVVPVSSNRVLLTIKGKVEAPDLRDQNKFLNPLKTKPSLKRTIKGAENGLSIAKSIEPETSPSVT